MSVRSMPAITRTVIRCSSALIAVFICTLLFSGSSYASGAAGSVGTWQTTTALPIAYDDQMASVSYNNYAYVIGGVTPGGSWSSAVYYAPMNSDGSVGTWQTASNSLPQAINNEAAVAYNGYLYAIGGDNSSAISSSVYYAPLNSDGSVGTWQTASSLPGPVANGAAVEDNGYVYVLGGNNSGGQVSSVYYAPLNSNGSIGTWQTASNLPSSSNYATAVVNNGYLYLVGGSSSTPLLYAPLNSNGSVGTWTTAAHAPTYNAFQLAAISNGYLYVYGGGLPFFTTGSVQSAPINSDGSVGTWTTSPNFMTSATTRAAGFAANGYLYSVGGINFLPVNSVEYAPLSYTSQLTLNNSMTNGPVLITIPQGDNLTCNSAATASSLAHQDSAYTYPLGLVKYCFTTNNLVNQVSLTFVTNLTPTQVVARDYNTTAGNYVSVPGAIITQTTYNGSPALKLTYTITDGGAFDEDGAANQSITDPVGLAVATTTSSSSSSAPAAPNTGYGQPQNKEYRLLLIASVILLAVGLRLGLRKKAKTD